MARLALIGDYDAGKTAHLAIPRALELARQATGVSLDWEWIGTGRVGHPAETLAGFNGVWVTPGSPYVNMDGALAAIRHAPFSPELHRCLSLVRKSLPRRPNAAAKFVPVCLSACSRTKACANF